jgi:hypothetical protein
MRLKLELTESILLEHIDDTIIKGYPYSMIDINSSCCQPVEVALMHLPE